MSDTPETKPPDVEQPGYVNGEVRDDPVVNSAVVGVDVVSGAGNAPGVFDPGEHTVDEVQAYLADHPDETDAVLAAEADGKARTTLIGNQEAK